MMVSQMREMRLGDTSESLFGPGGTEIRARCAGCYARVAGDSEAGRMILSAELMTGVQ